LLVAGRVADVREGIAAAAAAIADGRARRTLEVLKATSRDAVQA
jgi:anthranilate phosphoribosyltransferase